VRIVTDGGTGYDITEKICQRFKAEFFPTEFKTPEGDKTALINKTLMHEKSPYEISVFLDADTIIVNPFDELFAWARAREFVVPQFHDWKTRGKIAKRIRAWEGLYPDMIKPAMAYGQAINCGVYAWHKDSTLMREWWNYACPGRTVHRIPDETCLQVILPKFKHHLAPAEFNASCRYGNPYRPQARIIHFHGNKHARVIRGKFMFASDIWYKTYFEIAHESIVKKATEFDRMLRRHEVLAKRIMGK
jgi:hypothetical protein